MKKSCKVMILGGNGFIGKNLTRYLTEQGHRVSVFDLCLPEERLPGVIYMEGDFFSPQTPELVSDGQDVVIHALSSVNPGNSNRAYMRGYEGDFLQTVRLFDRACQTGMRVIFLSSAGTVYGSYDGAPFSEDHALFPINHYGSLKVCVESVLRSFNRQQRGRLISCRISNPYGPGQDYRKGVGFIDAAIKHFLAGSTLEIWGDGSVVRDYIYIEDVCKMIEGLLSYEGPEDVFNLSTGIGHSQLEILEMFKRSGRNIRVSFLPARSVDARINIVANDRITAATGVRCRPLEEGIRTYLNLLDGTIG